MQEILTLGMGYLIGCFHPAAILAKLKKVDLKQEGTKNLGATNTALVLGVNSGVLVMLLDIFKSYFAARVAKLLFPQLAIAGLLASLGAILGHCFPVFLGFQGGKGLAAYGGMVLAYDPWIFLMLLIPGVTLMLVLHTAVAIPMLASAAFPLLVWLKSGSPEQTLTALAAGILLAVMHIGNLKKAMKEKDFDSIGDFLRDKLFHKH